jgi:hypothetical protein
VSRNWLDSVAPTFRSAGAGLKAGATSNALASYFVDTTLVESPVCNAEPQAVLAAQATDALQELLPEDEGRFSSSAFWNDRKAPQASLLRLEVPNSRGLADSSHPVAAPPVAM